jgi:hypothetical protein
MWYEGEFKEWVQQTIMDELPSFMKRSYVNSLLKRKDFVDRLYNSSEDYRTSTRDVFSILMLVLWFKEYASEINR